ncbi:hypothetical protein ABMA27_011031 [Loxostege sticticalis]|uniref:PWWP domain-containing protein n=1 Tax=Loxostege sticticalis TaxID=481309 RepID=A0ABR3H3F5_LOXSC
MGKKVREYKSGDFIFAKVKGYPAWPARVQKMIGKKYFVYFYGTGETANLPPNMIFDYAENKEKFLTKTVKRRDFNDGVKQIEHDFANNVPLEQVIGVAAEAPAEANDSANDTANETMDDTMADTTAADETMADESTANATANDTAVEDSDDAALKGRKPKDAKTPAKETAAKPAKEPKTPRGKAKKDAEKEDEEEKNKEEEIVSRSGRKIRPKRYIDEQTEENATLPSPLPKKRRGASPAAEKEKEKETKDKPEKSGKLYNAVPQSELEDMKEPFKQEDPEKDNILIAYLPSGQYVGVKLFQSRPSSFKNESTRLQWDKRAASNAITLKLQLERGQITPQSIQAQLVMDLNLTDEEKAALDKERETEEKKSRVQFLKTEMKLIELDAKIKTCLCLEKADTELCLKLLDELMELDVKPLMLLKHPTCLETVKRMRAYVGNTPSWDLSESAALVFSKQAHKIRRQADALYKNVKELFVTPEGLSFWEFFSERVLQFKKATAKLSADELLELVHEPLEMTVPTSHTMKAAVDAANEEEPADEEDTSEKKKGTPVKPKKTANNTPSKPPLKRQSSRKQQQEEKEKEKESNSVPEEQADEQTKPEEAEKPDESEKEENTEDNLAESKEKESKDNEATSSKEKNKEKESTNKKESNNKEAKKETNNKDSKKEAKDKKEAANSKDAKKDSKNKEAEVNDAEEKTPEKEVEKENETEKEDPSPSDKDKSEKKDSEDKEDKAEDKDKDIAEPRAKRSRESKKTEPPPPRSPAKRKSKF